MTCSFGVKNDKIIFDLKKASYMLFLPTEKATVNKLQRQRLSTQNETSTAYTVPYSRNCCTAQICSLACITVMRNSRNIFIVFVAVTFL